MPVVASDGKRAVGLAAPVVVQRLAVVHETDHQQDRPYSTVVVLSSPRLLTGEHLQRYRGHRSYAPWSSLVSPELDK
ncbi:hypothetical protein RRF57_005205 [Xylaria bambusicola]|uniref:Uncharacterized protein n=1 Tax=Xylaria bambusicola TaxID=326684 RepID=A0AAN7UBT3_9PEZI